MGRFGSISSDTTAIAVADGGTGASTAAGARANLDAARQTGVPPAVNFVDGEATTLNAAALQITGDIDIRARILPVWNPPTNGYAIVSKRVGATGEYSLRINSSRTLTLTSYASGGPIVRESTAALPASTVPFWVRCTHDVDMGASPREVKFFTSADGVAWTQLGTTISAGAGVFTALATTNPVVIGDEDSIRKFVGRIYEVEVRDGIDGTLVLRFDADDVPEGAWGSSTWVGSVDGRTYAATGTATVEPSTFLPVSAGGTGADTAAGAREALGLPMVFNVRHYGAVGDGVADDTFAIQRAIDLASANSGAGQRVKVLIPPGVYLTGDLEAKSNIAIENQGVVRQTSTVNGGFLNIRVANVEVFGGLWDGNGAGTGNVNAIALTDNAENVWIHDLRIANCFHGGDHLTDIDDPAEVGTGGGKGITVQHGSNGVLIDNVVIDDCAFGISVEALWTDPTIDVVISNTVIRRAKWAGLFFTGQFSTARYDDLMNVDLSNVTLINCAVGQTDEDTPRDISELFGAITCNAAQGVRGNVTIHQTTGSMTVLRGAHRFCDLNLRVISGAEVVHVIDSEAYGGFGPVSSLSMFNQAKVFLLTNDSMPTGLLLHDVSSSVRALQSQFEFMTACYVGTTLTAFPVANMVDAAQFNASNRVLLWDAATALPTTRGADSLHFNERASDPAAPAANGARLYSRDNGSGKTQLCVRFATGAVQVIATEP